MPKELDEKRDLWISEVKTPARHPPLSDDEKQELASLLMTKVFRRACALVYERVDQECLARLGSDFGVVAFRNSPNVVFGMLWEMLNE